ncbi:hypothetical protein BD309DRAFT_133911 [Dichomitus squalens]|nr:hypothetical protein BD309DRAFT_133911 [Dichomitus squalens]
MSVDCHLSTLARHGPTLGGSTHLCRVRDSARSCRYCEVVLLTISLPESSCGHAERHRAGLVCYIFSYGSCHLWLTIL